MNSNWIFFIALDRLFLSDFASPIPLIVASLGLSLLFGCVWGLRASYDRLQKRLRGQGLPPQTGHQLVQISKLKRLVFLTAEPWIDPPCVVQSLHLLCEVENPLWERNHLLQIATELLDGSTHPYAEGLKLWFEGVGADPLYLMGMETLKAGNNPQEPVVLDSLSWEPKLPLTVRGHTTSHEYQIGFPDLLLPGLPLPMNEDPTPCMVLLRDSHPIAAFQWKCSLKESALEAATVAHRAGLQFALILPETHGPTVHLAGKLNHCPFFPGCDGEQAGRHLQRLILEEGFPSKWSRRFHSPRGRVACWMAPDWDLPEIQWPPLFVDPRRANLTQFLKLYTFSRKHPLLIRIARLAETLLGD